MKRTLLLTGFFVLAMPAIAQVPESPPVQLTAEQQTELRARMQAATSAEERAQIRAEYGLPNQPGQGSQKRAAGPGQGPGGKGIHEGPMDGSGNQYMKSKGKGKGKGPDNRGR